MHEHQKLRERLVLSNPKIACLNSPAIVPCLTDTTNSLAHTGLPHANNSVLNQTINSGLEKSSHNYLNKNVIVDKQFTSADLSNDVAFVNSNNVSKCVAANITADVTSTWYSDVNQQDSQFISSKQEQCCSTTADDVIKYCHSFYPSPCDEDFSYVQQTSKINKQSCDWSSSACCSMQYIVVDMPLQIGMGSPYSSSCVLLINP